MYEVVTNIQEQKQAFAIWKTTMAAGAVGIPHPDKKVSGTLFDRSNPKLTFYLGLNSARNGIWCHMGVDPKRPTTGRWMTTQINVLFGDIRSTAGRIVKDEHGKLFLAHKGGLGGGRNPVSIAKFNAAYRNANIHTVLYPAQHGTKLRKQQKFHIFGPVDSASLPTQLVRFVDEAQRIRDMKKAGLI